MTQPQPIADPREVHQRAMKISDEDALQLWALVTLDATGFREYVKHQQSLKVRNFQASQGVFWQYGGQRYPQNEGELLRPGQREWMPLIAAKYGVRNTAKWEYMADEAGNTINRQDYNGPTVPIVHILEIRNPGDFREQQAVLAAATPRQAVCTLCNEEFDPAELANHMLTEHRAELAAQAAGKTTEPSRSRRQVEEWAAEQAKKKAASAAAEPVTVEAE